jgi:hypothetical protein
MKSDAGKCSKFSICQRQFKVQRGVKLSAFFCKERPAIWQRCESQNPLLDRPRIWLGFVSTLFDRALSVWRSASQMHIVINTHVMPS